MKTLIVILGLFAGSAAEDISVTRLLDEGDSAYLEYDNEKALSAYIKAADADTLSYTAAWKIARAYVDLGELVPQKKERKLYFRRAEESARKAVAIAPDSVEGHVFLSVALGNVALDAGAKQRVRLANEIKATVKRALEIDADNAIAWHVLGRWHREVATISWLEKRFASLLYGGVPSEASLDSSVQCLNKAISIEPGFAYHHYELAVTYEKMKRLEDARQHYNTVIELPQTDADDAIHKRNARRRLQKLD